MTGEGGEQIPETSPAADAGEAAGLPKRGWLRSHRLFVGGGVVAVIALAVALVLVLSTGGTSHAFDADIFQSCLLREGYSVNTSSVIVIPAGFGNEVNSLSHQPGFVNELEITAGNDESDVAEYRTERQAVAAAGAAGATDTNFSPVVWVAYDDGQHQSPDIGYCAGVATHQSLPSSVSPFPLG